MNLPTLFYKRVITRVYHSIHVVNSNNVPTQPQTTISELAQSAQPARSERVDNSNGMELSELADSSGV